MLKGKPAPGASQAALDLIQDQQCTHLRATSPQGLHPLGIRNANACISLDGLEQHACGALGDVFKGFKVVQPNVSNIRKQGAKGVFLLFVSTECECSGGAAVVAALKGDHFSAPGDPAREFEGGFVGFGA